jgi:hypothetical protein
LASAEGLVRVKVSSKRVQSKPSDAAWERPRHMGDEARSAARAMEPLERKDRVLIV